MKKREAPSFHKHRVFTYRHQTQAGLCLDYKQGSNKLKANIMQVLLRFINKVAPTLSKHKTECKAHTTDYRHTGFVSKVAQTVINKVAHGYIIILTTTQGYAWFIK